jgi:hypothetical protein
MKYEYTLPFFEETMGQTEGKSEIIAKILVAAGEWGESQKTTWLPE